MYCAIHIFGNQYMRPVRFPLVFLHIFPYRILHLILPIEVWLGSFQRPGVRFRAQRYVEGGRAKVDGASNCGKGTLGRDHHKPSTFWAVSFSAGIPCAIQWKYWHFLYFSTRFCLVGWLIYAPFHFSMFFPAVPFSLLQALDENKSSTVTVGAFMVLNSALNLPASNCSTSNVTRSLCEGMAPHQLTIHQSKSFKAAWQEIAQSTSCINLPEKLSTIDSVITGMQIRFHIPKSNRSRNWGNHLSTMSAWTPATCSKNRIQHGWDGWVASLIRYPRVVCRIPTGWLNRIQNLVS